MTTRLPCSAPGARSARVAWLSCEVVAIAVCFLVDDLASVTIERQSSGVTGNGRVVAGVGYRFSHGMQQSRLRLPRCSVHGSESAPADAKRSRLIRCERRMPSRRECRKPGMRALRSQSSGSAVAENPCPRVRGLRGGVPGWQARTGVGCSFRTYAVCHCTLAERRPSWQPPHKDPRSEGSARTPHLHGERLELLLVGIAPLLLGLAGLIVLEGPADRPELNQPPAVILSYFGEQDTVILGSFLLMLAAVAFIWFAGSLRVVLRRKEGGEGRLSAIAFGGGVAAGVCMLAWPAANLFGALFAGS